MKDKINSILFMFTIFLFMFLGIILKDKDISFSERRHLASFPKITINNDFSEKLDNYFLDQFPFRDSFKKLKGETSKKIMLMKENNGIYEQNGYLFQIDNNINDKSIDNLINKINYINDNYLNENQNKYFIMIPDKNYYLDNKNIPKIDYEYMKNKLKYSLDYLKWIDITSSLTLDSYYKTDIHWKQECLQNVLNKIQSSLNLEIKSENYIENKYYPFYGALYVDNIVKPDTLNYYSNYVINNAKVYNYEKSEYQKVYNEDNLKNIDSYDIFLSGATPILFIENQNNKDNKNLIIFRDSFASSLVPLLIEDYSKITLIDLRYVNSRYLNKINDLNFDDNSDIIFMYSTLIINNSFAIK